MSHVLHVRRRSRLSACLSETLKQRVHDVSVTSWAQSSTANITHAFLSVEMLLHVHSHLLNMLQLLDV